jgi:hypothetical protein
MSSTTLTLETARTRLAIVEALMAEYYGSARFEAERAMFVPGFAPGPYFVREYRKLFEERDELRAQLGMPVADLQWPLVRP